MIKLGISTVKIEWLLVSLFQSILLDWVIGREVEIQSSKREHMNKIRQAAADMVVSYQREVKPTVP